KTDPQGDPFTPLSGLSLKMMAASHFQACFVKRRFAIDTPRGAPAGRRTASAQRLAEGLLSMPCTSQRGASLPKWNTRAVPNNSQAVYLAGAIARDKKEAYRTMQVLARGDCSSLP
ncbi:unnamed protein product, partial [Effrenium voratum]